MRYEYPVHYERDADSPELWNVRVLGLVGDGEEAVTCGNGLEDARHMASDLVDTWLVTHLREGNPLPQPGALPAGAGWELVGPSLRVASALLLRQMRSEAGWSQTETARRLGVKQPVYAALEDPQKSNPTLATLERISRAFAVPFELRPRVSKTEGIRVSDVVQGSAFAARSLVDDPLGVTKGGSRFYEARGAAIKAGSDRAGARGHYVRKSDAASIEGVEVANADGVRKPLGVKRDKVRKK